MTASVTHSDNGTVAKRQLERRNEEDRQEMLTRVADLEKRWSAFWRSLAVGAIGFVAMALVGGIYVARAESDTEVAKKTAITAKAKSESNEHRIERVEEVLTNHADHLTDLLAGQQAIAEAVGAKLPKRTVRVEGKRQ